MSMTACFNQLMLPSNSTDHSEENNTSFKLRIRTNTYPLKYIDVFQPVRDASVPYAVMLGMDKIRTAKGNKQKLLAGYFSALCAVLPDLTELAYRILLNHGFTMNKVMVSEFSVCNKKKKIRCFDKMIEDLSIAQLIYLPFASNFKGIEKFWKTVARNAGIPCPIYLVPEKDVKTLHSAFMLSGLIAQLRTKVYLAQHALASLTGTPFGIIFTEATKCINIEQKRAVSQCVVTYELNI